MLYRIGDGTAGPFPFLPFTSGVFPRELPDASLFFNDSFFSRCSRSRTGGLVAFEAAGLRGEGTAGAWSTSRGRLSGGIAEGIAVGADAPASILRSRLGEVGGGLLELKLHAC
jgi:hypothetical protein